MKTQEEEWGHCQVRENSQMEVLEIEASLCDSISTLLCLYQSATDERRPQKLMGIQQ